MTLDQRKRHAVAITVDGARWVLAGPMSFAHAREALPFVRLALPWAAPYLTEWREADGHDDGE